MRILKLFAAAAELIAAIVDAILALFAGLLRAITGSGAVMPPATPVAELAFEASAADDEAELKAERRRREREARRAAAALRRQQLPGHVRRALKAAPAPRTAPVAEEEPEPDWEVAPGFRM